MREIEMSRLTLGHPVLMAGWLGGCFPSQGYKRKYRLGRGNREKVKGFDVGIWSVTGLQDACEDDKEGPESVSQETG